MWFPHMSLLSGTAEFTGRLDKEGFIMPQVLHESGGCEVNSEVYEQ